MSEEGNLTLATPRPKGTDEERAAIMSDDYFSDTSNDQPEYHVYKCVGFLESSEGQSQADVQSASSPAQSSSEPQHDTHFSLMKLSPEIRLAVYDCLFMDLTINRQRKVADLDRYHGWRHWPDNDFTAYRNLLLACRLVKEEAKDLWEKSYARHCCFYMWKVPELFRLFRLLTELGEPYCHMKYALRSRSGEELDGNIAEFIDDEVAHLMVIQQEFSYDWYNDYSYGWPEFNFENGPGMQVQTSGGGLPYEIYQTGTLKSRLFARADYPDLPSCSIAVHERQSHRQQLTQYLLMSGEVGKVSWDTYDAPTAYAKVKIWEEWQRRGFPSRCLAKADAVLSWRAEAMSGQDQEWLALGKEKYADLEDIEDLQLRLDLGGWLADIEEGK